MTSRNNRPHFHIWRLARTGRIFYVLKRGFHTRQAARQWAQRREKDQSRYMILQCDSEKCCPPL